MWGRHAQAMPPLPAIQPPQATDGILAARKAQNSARNSLLDAVESGIESRNVTERMRDLRAINHFGPTLETALRPENE